MQILVYEFVNLLFPAKQYTRKHAFQVMYRIFAEYKLKACQTIVCRCQTVSRLQSTCSTPVRNPNMSPREEYGYKIVEHIWKVAVDDMIHWDDRSPCLCDLVYEEVYTHTQTYINAFILC